jgi:hypothetical protein
MSQHYLAIGSHDSTPRVVELWVLASGIWNWLWTANDPCPGTFFGFAMAIDERIPHGSHPGSYGTVAAGNPAALLSGRVYIYMTYSAGELQVLHYGFGNETEHICFGESVSADSGILAVGIPSLTYGGQAKAGSVYIYLWNPALSIQGEYEFLVQIPPPVPTLNGGFGVSVGTWEGLVVIGDNQHNIYEYEISGFSAIPVLLEQPVDLNLASRNGYAVTIWDQFIASGDEDFIPDPTRRGATFVWDANPLLFPFYRRMYTLDDPSAVVNTRYGADVDNRGGCYIVSGIPEHPPYGGVWVTNLCRRNCYGCDGVLNSCAPHDICGVCLGDNSTCVDCFGVFHGKAVEDACDVCGGTNTTCIIPTFSLAVTINCSTVYRTNLTHLFQTQWGNAVWSLVSPLPSDGNAVLLTETVNPGSVLVTTLEYIPIIGDIGIDHVYLNGTVVATGATAIFNITFTIGTCNDCFGVHNGTAKFDLCGVCNGTNATCLGCDGVPNSEKVLDACDVCGGNGRECLNITTMTVLDETCTAQIIIEMMRYPPTTPVTWSFCAPPSVGSAYINPNTGVLLWHNPGISGPVTLCIEAISGFNSSVFAKKNITFEIANCTDCNGNQLGLQILDVCGVCGGPGTECIDCFGIPFGNATRDLCGVCNGTNTTCVPGQNPLGVVIMLIVIFTLIGFGLLYACLATFIGDFKLVPVKVPPSQHRNPPRSSFVVTQPVQLAPVGYAPPGLNPLNSPSTIAINAFGDSRGLPTELLSAR